MANNYTYMKKPDNSAIKIVKHNAQSQSDLEVEFNLLDGSAKINLVNHKAKEIHSVKMTGDTFTDLMDLCERIRHGDLSTGETHET